MDSELLRRIGCFLSLQTPRPLKFTCRFGYIVFLWLWTLHCSKRDLVELNQIRCQLQSGSLPKDRPLHKPTQSVCSPDDLQLKHHRLFLESLHFHLINWSNRLQHLKDRLAEKDPAIDLEEFVSPDLTVMRLLLKNCQLCLDEAERALHPPQPTTTDAQEVPPTPIASTHEATEPKSLDSEDPVVDDECLEAIVDESDLAPTDLDSFYDEWDFSGRPITKAEVSSVACVFDASMGSLGWQLFSHCIDYLITV
uniref:SERTA domain-containing protein n=1 Tax=Mesocestoides corti TaxID=53468 RepID=A0A5K3EQI8_MESCO